MPLENKMKFESTRESKATGEKDMSAMNYYEILGVSRSATKEEIKDAFRKLSPKHHPDIVGENPTFRYLSEAYSVLKDHRKKGIYDDSLQYYEQSGAVSDTIDHPSYADYNEYPEGDAKEPDGAEHQEASEPSGNSTFHSEEKRADDYESSNSRDRERTHPNTPKNDPPKQDPKYDERNFITDREKLRDKARKLADQLQRIRTMIHEHESELRVLRLRPSSKEHVLDLQEELNDLKRMEAELQKTVNETAAKDDELRQRSHESRRKWRYWEAA